MSAEDKIKKMEALISLVDEPDDEVFAEISGGIEEFGSEIIPFLENAWEQQYQPAVQKRLENLIHSIQFKKVGEDLERWLENGATDLLEGCLIIARYQYPNLKEHEIEYELSRIRKDIWIELNDNLTALEQIKVFNYVFYELQGFKGNVDKYHSPDNSFINKVLETRQGNPLTLSIIYMIIAQSLDLPLKGVNLPEHFVLAYTGASIDPETYEFKSNNILFYINVFSRGTVFSYKDIDLFLKQINRDSRPEFYQPCQNTDIIKRMISNLILAFQKANDSEKADEVSELAALLENQLKKAGQNNNQTK